MRLIATLFSLVLLSACKHPLEVVGNGDIFSLSGTRDCLLEDSLAGSANCVDNAVVGESYVETYIATPRPGWKFERWENYCTDVLTNECSFSVGAETVAQFDGAVANTLRAIFVPEPKEVVKLTVDSTFDTPRSANDVLMDGNFVYVADSSETVLVLQITTDRQLIQMASVELGSDVSAYGLSKAGDYLYVAGREGGLSVIDVSDPTSPVAGASYTTPDISLYASVAGDTLYLSDRQGLVGFDISDRAQPYQVWSLNAGKLAFLRSVVQDGELVIAGYTDGLKTYTTPSTAPVLDSSFSIGRPAWSIASYQDAADGKQYFLAGGERAGFTVYDPLSNSRVGEIFALTDIPNPTKDDETAFHILTEGQFAYVANGNNGIQVIGLEDITEPYLAGQLATSGEVRGIDVSTDTLVIAETQRGVRLVSIEVLPDSDGDGFEDAVDDFPLDPSEWRDADGDGIGNNADPDDDNDGIEDEFDTDADNDGYDNTIDMFPNDPLFWIDSDGDSVGDNNPLLLVDDESIHVDIQGDWQFRLSSSAYIGSSYQAKIADNSNATVTWSPIITDAGSYNVYSSALFPFSSTISQVANYEVNIEGVTTNVVFEQGKRLRNWNFIGEFQFPLGNQSTVTLTDEGDGVAEVFADAITLIPSLTVPDSFGTNNQYEFLGAYTNPNLGVWNLKRILLDPIDAGILYGAFNSTADLCSFDVSDLANPTLMNCYVSEDNGAGYEVVRKGQHLILADRFAGVRIFEVTAPGTFSLVTTIPTFDKVSRVVLDGDVLYVGDTLGGMLTYDVADPANPISLGRIEIGAETRDMRIKGNYAYVSNYYRGMAVVDVTDPANPTLAARLKDPWNAFLGGVWDLELKDDLLFMLVQSYGVQIVDVSNPLAPVVVSEVKVPNGRDFDFAGEIHDDQPPLGIELVNDLLIVSNGAHGVLLFDVSDINNITLVERIDTPSVAGEAKMLGTVLYVADGRGSGLQIYDISAFSYLFAPE